MRKNGFYWSIKVIILAVCFSCVTFIGITNANDYTIGDLHEQNVLGTVWYQRSAELRALCYQAFNMAKLIYDMDLEKGESTKKRAVSVDINETVLNNSPYMAGLVDKNIGYPTGWIEWKRSGNVKALPGAVEFLNYVVRKGGDVFYISNSKIKHKDSVMKNLKALGFPQVLDDHVLLRNTSSNKEPRRALVRQTHRIVLLIGDNLNDLDGIFRKKSLDDRAALVDQAYDKFGSKFIVIPNPMYGDWEGSIYKGDWNLSPTGKSNARKAALFKWELQ